MIVVLSSDQGSNTFLTCKFSLEYFVSFLYKGSDTPFSCSSPIASHAESVGSSDSRMVFFAD